MTLKAKLAAGGTVVGTWLKTPHPIVAEVLALSALDCLVLDAEHAPFDRASIDACLGAARHLKPILVRTPSAAPEQLLQALDCGAAGVIVPHVRSAAEAEAVVKACQYGPGGRGFAGTPRAGGYGTHGMARIRVEADPVIIAQVEDLEAVDAIEAICAVDGIDALFIGRADLTVAYGAATADDSRVVAAVKRICAVGVAHGRRIGMFLPRPADTTGWVAQGATLFLLASDHDFMLAGAKALMAEAGQSR